MFSVRMPSLPCLSRSRSRPMQRCALVQSDAHAGAVLADLRLFAVANI